MTPHLLSIFVLIQLSSSVFSSMPTGLIECGKNQEFLCDGTPEGSDFYYWCGAKLWRPCPGGSSCDQNRDYVACEKDGTPYFGNDCGDGVCGKRETCQSCPRDCECSVCSDGVCDDRESCLSCPSDCGECRSDYPDCGNGVCDDEEDCSVCPQDCGICYPYACAEVSCKLPDCKCASSITTFEEERTPQFVYMSFDDAITESVYDVLRDLMDNFNATDAGGCTPKGVHFLSNSNTDYFLLGDLLYRYGNELGGHTITHNTGTKTNRLQWFREIEFGRRFSAEMTVYPKYDIVGFRAPYFAYTGSMFTVLNDVDFLYDSSIAAKKRPGNMLWPYTLNHGTPYDICDTGNCPEVSNPGLWEFPLNVLYDGVKIHSVIDPEGGAEFLLDLYKQNFMEHYEGNRSPFGIIMHPAWLIGDRVRRNVIHDFFEWASTHENVFFRTPKEIIEWIKKPISVESMKTSSNCHYTNITTDEPTCPTINGTTAHPITCRFSDSNLYFKTCADDCYLRYPSTQGYFSRSSTPQVDYPGDNYTYLSTTSDTTQRTSPSQTDSTLPDSEETSPSTLLALLAFFSITVLAQ